MLLSLDVIAQNVDFTGLPKTKNQYRIKFPASRKAQKSYQKFLSKKLETDLVILHDSIWLNIPDGAAAVNKFFCRRRDGVALEIVPFDQFSCDESLYHSFPSRRNHNSLFSGSIQKPLYKRKMYRNSRSSSKKGIGGDVRIFLGLVSENRSQGNDQLNLFILKRRRVVDIWHFGNRCPQPLLWYHPSFPMAEIVDHTPRINFIPRLVFDTLRMFIPFEKNDVFIPSNYTDHLRHFVSRASKEIYQARIQAYASVEGTPEINRKLYERRAEPLVKIIREYADTAAIISEISKENWDLYFRQVQNLPDSLLKAPDTLQIRKYLSDSTVASKYKSLLDQQRFTSVVVIMKPRLTDANIDSLARNEYLELYNLVIKNVNSGKWSAIPQKTKKRLAEIQLFLFQRHLDGKINIQFIKDLPLNTELMERDSKDKLFEPLIFHRLYFEYLHFAGKMDKDSVYQHLKQLRKYTGVSSAVLYNYHALSINEGLETENHLNELQGDLARIQNAVFDTVSVENLTTYYHHQNAIRYYDPFSARIRNKAKRSNMYLFQHYLKVNQKEKSVLMAKHLLAFGLKKQALDLLLPFLTGPNADHEALKLKLQIQYAGYSEVEPQGYYDDLINAASVLTPNEWCELFTNPCGLNFQLLNEEELWRLFCKNSNIKTL